LDRVWASIMAVGQARRPAKSASDDLAKRMLGGGMFSGVGRGGWAERFLGMLGMLGLGSRIDDNRGGMAAGHLPGQGQGVAAAGSSLVHSRTRRIGAAAAPPAVGSRAAGRGGSWTWVLAAGLALLARAWSLRRRG
jgi:hypothetical protein